MKTKKMQFIKSFLSSFLCCSTPFIFLVSSCSSDVEPLDTYNIYFNKAPITTENHDFVLPFQCNKNVCGPIEVNLIYAGNPEDLTIENTSVLIENSTGTLHFIINPDIRVSTSFNFDLECTFKLKNGTIMTEKYWDFFAYYSDTPIQDKDMVFLTTKTLTQENVHRFEFELQFEKKPVNEIVYVALIDERTGLLSLESESFSVFKEQGIYKAKIALNVDMEIHESRSFPFSLQINFINSHQVQQTETIKDCCAHFEFAKYDEVPEDYFDVEQSGSIIQLKGLKPGVSEAESGHYTVLRIPEYVTNIEIDAFATNWFSEIKKIIIPKSVTNIGLRAFYGCCKVEEIDLTDFDNTTMGWLNSSLFSSIQNIAGYIWTSNLSSEDVRSIRSHIDDLGLPNDWTVYNVQDVIPDDFYTFSDDEKTTLSGFDKDKLVELENYKIVKIPDSVKKINANAMSELSSRPYKFTHNDGTIELQTRRLILGKNITSLPEKLFKFTGIAGPIIIHCPQLEILPQSCFECASWYGQPQLHDIVEEETRLVMLGCNQLSQIENYCFNAVRIKQKTLQLPLGLTVLGDYAFASSMFEDVIFDANLTSVGSNIFTNTYYQPSNPTITNIDLSCYDIIFHEIGKDTYIPPWFNDNLRLFLDGCKNNGTLLLSQKIADEVTEPKIEEWKTKIRSNFGLPQSWNINFIETK